MQLGPRAAWERLDMIGDAGAVGHRGVIVWLVLVSALVLAMIAVGGATRLTDSGLSITEWQPILGAIPPLSTADWMDAFEKYKQIPEYSLVNKGMSLDAFKAIYWWEWAHRFLGRAIGVVFALPLAFFWWRGALAGGLKWRLLGLLALGGLQGAVGWFMVQSGLVDRVDVSHYRLALHLVLAFLILAALVWTILDLAKGNRAAATTGSRVGRMLARVVVGLMFLQVVLGAFVAGTKAGLSYNTWPLMDGQLVPDGLWAMRPWWINVFENLTMIQFNHRLMAYGLVGLAAWQAILCRTGPHARTAALTLVAMVAQAGLGIWTLVIAQGAIPLGLGIAHQGFAAITLAIAVTHLHGVLRGAAIPITPQADRPGGLL